MITKQHRADRFHFGFCNACERYACGESSEQIRATPTKDAVITTQAEAFAVTAGAQTALIALVDGEIELAMRRAHAVGLSAEVRAGLRDLVLSA